MLAFVRSAAHFCFLCIVMGFPSYANAQDRQCAGDAEPMTFEILKSEAVEGEIWRSIAPDFFLIQAKGQICGSTPDEFARFSRLNLPPASSSSVSPPPRILIVFDSKGGRSIPATQLGRIIRNMRAETTFSQHCDSACVYALAGGYKRYWPGDPEAPNGIGIHRLSLSWGVNDQPDEDEILKLLGSMQLSSSMLSQYLTEMGVDHRLFDISTQYGNAMFQLNRDVSIALKIVNGNLSDIER